MLHPARGACDVNGALLISRPFWAGCQQAAVVEAPGLRLSCEGQKSNAQLTSSLGSSMDGPVPILHHDSVSQLLRLANFSVNAVILLLQLLGCRGEMREKRLGVKEETVCLHPWRDLSSPLLEIFTGSRLYLLLPPILFFSFLCRSSSRIR